MPPLLVKEYYKAAYSPPDPVTQAAIEKIVTSPVSLEPITAEVAKRVELSGLSPESQQMATQIITQYIVPPLLYASSFPQNAAEKEEVLSTAQRVFVDLGIAEYQKGQPALTPAYQEAVQWIKTQPYFLANIKVPPGSISTPQVQELFNQFFSLAAQPGQDQAIQAAVQKVLASSLGPPLISALGSRTPAAMAAALPESITLGIAKRVGSSGLSPESQQMATQIITQYILPSMAYAASFSPDEITGKGALSTAQRVFVDLGIAEYQKGQPALTPAYQEAVQWIKTQPYFLAISSSSERIRNALRQHQINQKVLKLIDLSGLSPEERRIATQIITQQLLPSLQYAASFAKDESEKRGLLPQIQQVFVHLGLAAHQKDSTLTYRTAYLWIAAQSFYQFTSAGQPQYGPPPQVAGFYRQLFSFASGKIQDRVTRVAMQKFLSSSMGKGITSALGLGTKAAATAAAKAGLTKAISSIAIKTLAAIGIADPEPITKAIIFVATLLLDKLRDLASWLKRQVKEYILPLLAGLLTIGLAALGGITSLFGLAAAGIVGGIAGSALSVGGLSRLGAGASRFFNSFAGLAVTQIATPVIVISLSIPVAVAFILFIINTSALVVPPGGPTSGISPGPVASGSCPLAGTVQIYQSSYNESSQAGHGSNAYWGTTPPVCTYPIPIDAMVSGCWGPVNSTTNVCRNASSLCPYYGFAADLKPPDTSLPNVVLPTLCGPGINSCPPLTWTVEQGWFNCGGGAVPNPQSCSGSKWGYGVVFNSSGNGANWKIYLNHFQPVGPLLDQSGVIKTGGSFSSGDVMGTISSTLAPPHLHVELDINGVPVRPDFLCQAGAGGPVNGWLVTAPLSDASTFIASTPLEYKNKTCDWSGAKSGVTYAINANYFNTNTDPEGPAGHGGSFTNYPPTRNVEPYSLIVDSSNNASIVASSSLPSNLSGYKLAISGIPFYPSINTRAPRAAVGIGGGNLYMLILQAATGPETEIAIRAAGATEAILLDGGQSATLCQGGNIIFGNTRVVANSFAVKSGTMSVFSYP